MNQMVLIAVTIFPLISAFSCFYATPSFEQGKAPDATVYYGHQNSVMAESSEIADPADLLVSLEVYADTACNKTLQEVLPAWHRHSFPYEDYLASGKNIPDNHHCHWTRSTFSNPDSAARTTVIYFPKGWQHLECYIARPDGTFEKKNIGILYREEVLYLRIPPMDSMVLYVRYPDTSTAYKPKFGIRPMTDATYLTLRARTKYKFLLVGVLIFPLLFFLAQLLVQKDQLSLYYLLFLLGSTIHLPTILDTIPYFEVSPKLVASIRTIQRMFVLSTFLLLLGLIKYMHVFLDMASWSQALVKAGNVLLGVFLALVLVPVFYPAIFQIEHYEVYLQYFRVWALLLFVYVLWLNVRAVVAKIKFSTILFLAFSPFIACGVWYAISFIIIGGYSYHSAESLTLIVGFILTLLLFGVVLGVRNNAVKAEKIRLEQTADRLNELDRFKSRFYTNITHEFRTPLTVIKGMIGQISGNEKIKTVVERNSDRLLNMVNQLLDLSRLEAHSMSVDLVNGDIIPFLKYLTESCHSLAKNKDLNLAFFSKEACIKMDFDENKIQHILINLLSNAIKFTPRYGSVKVIACQVFENGRPFLLMEVKDTGIGIPKEKLDHIFNRFFQVDDSATRHSEGSGIGLSLVSELVLLLEGRIEVNSEAGNGASFLVYLPIRQKAPQKPVKEKASLVISHITEATPTEKAAPAPIHSEEEKPLVLIVEDNADVIHYIISCLNQDYTLKTARNGKQGVEMAFDTIPDLVLCDVMMPELDGFQVCRQLKSDRRTSHIPIVLLTAKSTQEDKLAGLAQGADAYLIKPFDKDELLLRIHNLTAQSRTLRTRLLSLLTTDRLQDEAESKEAKFLEELNQVITSNMGNELFNTTYLCRHMAMSRTQLYRKLKALTNQSTANYIRTTRLRKAKRYLETTDLPIGEIAVQVGYKDFSHFSRSFFKEFGTKPSEIRI